MTTLTIKVNERTVAGKRFISFIKTLPFVSIEKQADEDTKSKSYTGIEESMEDIKEGRVFSAKNTTEMFKQILG